jgi:hypothetical protein
MVVETDGLIEDPWYGKPLPIHDYLQAMFPEDIAKHKRIKCNEELNNKVEHLFNILKIQGWDQ